MTHTISDVRAREILDSRGRPTVEADVVLVDGSLGRASVPSGASVGSHEAVELRDRDPGRHRGLGVRQAVENVILQLGPAVIGCSAFDQAEVDRRLVETDGTPDRRRLGANALLAVSLATARAGAISSGLGLHRYLSEMAGGRAPSIPLPMINMLSGGLHAGGQLDIQDVLFIPTSARSFAEALDQSCAVHAALGDRLARIGERRLVADEGGWAPALTRNEDALAWVTEAMAAEGIAGHLAVDVAASHFHDPVTGTYELRTDVRQLDSDGLTEMLEGWIERYPVASLEDCLAEDDWDGWQRLTARLGGRLQVIGDDLFTTNLARLERGIGHRVANAVLVKPNQSGTLTETLAVLARARAAGYGTVVSARSGETEDAFIADLAVGVAAGQIKVGSVTRSSRLAKWNELLRIEEELGAGAYVGRTALGWPALPEGGTA
jgi:enolase